MGAKVKPTYKELENRIKELESRQNNSDIILNDFVFKSHIWIQNSPVCTKIVDLDFNLQFMSEAGIKVLKIENIEEYYGDQYPLNFFSDSFKTSMAKNLKKVKESGVITRDVEVLDINGQKIWFHSTIVPVYDEKGQPDYYLVISVDITEQKKIEEALKESERRYHSFFDAAFDSIFVSEKGICIDQNKKAELKFGYTLSEAIGKPGTDWISPEDRELVINNILSGREKPYRVNALTKAGTIFPCEIQASVTYYNGRELRITALRDITEEKQAEKELLKSRNHLEKLVKQRTVELEEENKKLDSAVKAFVGREQKLKELTETIKILENKIKTQ